MRTAILLVQKDGETTLSLVNAGTADKDFKVVVTSGEKGLELVQLWKSDRGIAKQKRFGGNVITQGTGTFADGIGEAITEAREQKAESAEAVEVPEQPTETQEPPKKKRGRPAKAESDPIAQ